MYLSKSPEKSKHRSTRQNKQDLLPQADYRTVFKQILLFVAEQESLIEQLRCILCEYPDFEPYSAFKRVDKRDRGLLSIHDIQNFLRENAFFVNENQIQRFIQHYDSNKDGHLSYIEFLKVVFPKRNQELRTMTNQRLLQKRPNLQVEVEKAFVRLIESDIRLFHSVSTQMAQMKSVFKKINAPKLFLGLDVLRKGKIGFEDVETFFRRPPIIPEDITQEQIINLLSRISQSDDDWLISLNDFEQFFFPTSSPYQAEQLSQQKEINEQLEDLERDAQVQRLGDRERKLDQQKSGKQVKQIVDFYLKRNKRKNQSLGLCYTSDFIGLLPETVTKFHRKPAQMCETHPDIFDKHDHSIAQIYKHKEPYRQRFERFEGMDYKSYSVFSNEYQQPGKYINSEQYRKIHQKELFTFLLALQEIFHLEGQISQDKQALVVRTDFTIQDYFSYFDVERKSFITKDNVQSFFEQYIFEGRDIEEEVQIFMNRYDQGQKGRITLEDICDLTIPDEKDLETVLNKKQTLGVSFEKLSQETQELIIDMINREVVNVRAIRDIWTQINQRTYFDLHKVFVMLDENNDGYLTLKDFVKEFKNSKNPAICKQDLKHLISLLDFDRDGKISYMDLLSTFERYCPKEENDDEI